VLLTTLRSIRLGTSQEVTYCESNRILVSPPCCGGYIIVKVNINYAYVRCGAETLTPARFSLAGLPGLFSSGFGLG